MFSRLVWMILLSASVMAQANEDNTTKKELNLLPMDYMNVQFAGNIGFLSVGIGNRFLDDLYALEIYYGYTPRLVSEVAISTVAVKNNLTPSRWMLFNHTIEPYIGLGVLYSFNQRYDPNWADDVPDNYYYQYSFHLIGYGGVSVMYPVKDPSATIRAFGGYVEVGTVDAYLIDYLSDNEALRLQDIGNIALGIRLAF